MAKFAEIYPDREFVQQLLANYQTLDLPCRFERAGTGAFVPDC